MHLAHKRFVGLFIAPYSLGATASPHGSGCAPECQEGKARNFEPDDMDDRELGSKIERMAVCFDVRVDRNAAARPKRMPQGWNSRCLPHLRGYRMTPVLRGWVTGIFRDDARRAPENSPLLKTQEENSCDDIWVGAGTQ
jgi:hypothetical protein